MNNALLRKYQDIRFKREQLEKEENEIKDQVVKYMQLEGISKEETTWGTFTIASRTSYKYSDKVKALEEKVKLAKVKEEQKGTATPSTTEYLVYTAPKV